MRGCRQQGSLLFCRAGKQAAVAAGFLLCCVWWCGAAQASPQSLETSIAAMEVKGKKPYEKLIIKDLDLLIEDTTRYLPLRRLATLFGYTLEEVGDSLLFRGARDESFALSAGTGKLRRNGDVLDLKVTSGISDITGLADYYLPETAITEIFNLKLTWDESAWGYLTTTESSYPVWKDKGKSKDKKKERGGRDTMRRIGVELPEVHPPVGPEKLGDPAVHFIQPGVKLTQNSQDRFTAQKTLESYGRLAGGRYAFKARQASTEFSATPTLEQASLGHRFGDFETMLGDVDLGLSDLVFPSLRMTGFQANGLLGLDSAGRAEDRSNFGKSDRYLSKTDVRGTAPMGSTVELYLGNRFIAEQKIVEPYGDAGNGLYRFEGVNLARDRVNEMKLVITEPDGKVTERYEELVGSTGLLQRGQLSFIGGGGTRRFNAPDLWQTQGQFYGGRLLFGATPYLTMGVTGAYQDRFSVPFQLDNLDSSRTAMADTFPVWSRHAGLETRLRLFRRHVLSLDAAASESYFRSAGSGQTRFAGLTPDSSVALRASLDMNPWSFIKLKPEVFRFSPGFFDGTNVAVQDRQGWLLASRLQPRRGLTFNLVHGEIQDNVLGRDALTNRERWEHLDFNVPRFIPRSSIRMALDRLERSVSGGGMSERDNGPWHIATINVTSTLLRVAELNSQIIVGDEQQDSPDEDLKRGLALPMASATFRPQWYFTLGRMLMKNGWLTVGHTSSQFRKRTEMTHLLRASSASPWQWRFDAGWDWTQESPYLQFQPEYFFDRSGFSRITTMARYQDKEWLFMVGLQLQPAISLVGGRPFVIPHSQLSPANGGVKGVVFLDRNGNGSRDDREPGIPGIEVLAEGGRRAKSGKHGEFVLGGSSFKRRMHVTLDARTLTANYSATNGGQWAEIEPGVLTPVALGLVEPGSISGFLIGPDHLDTTLTKGIDGVRVVARDTKGAVKGESISYTDGSFFIGSLMPGDYSVGVDPATLPKGYFLTGDPIVIAVRGGDDGQLDVSDVEVRLRFDRPVPEDEKRR